MSETVPILKNFRLDTNVFTGHWIVVPLVYICVILTRYVVKTLLNEMEKLKPSCIKLFTVSGVLTDSRRYCLQKCEQSMHNCTLISFEVS